ncbi:TadE/TadG family type IV pilus assembly protein [Roseibium sp. M-1]
MRPSGKLWRRLAAFRRDARAVAATEFALILPFMLLLLIGMAEVTGAMNEDRKVSRIANAVTDLVAQAQTVTTTELKAVMDLGEKIMAPYPATDLVTTIASISFDEDGDASVDWSYDSKGSKPWAKGSKPPVTIPDNVANPNTSIVLGKVSLDYTPPFAGVFTDFFSRESEITLSDTYYLRPRLTDTVDCTNC